MKKSVFGLLMTTVMLLSLAAPLVSTVVADEADWYMTVDGVLDSDYYWLYPYEKDSLVVGFSKFGELINSDDNVGLEYAGAVDPFAFPAGSDVSATVPKRMWVQGWFMNITYTHRTVGPRNVWAGALHSDAVVYGNDWLRVDFNNDRSTTYGQEDFRDPGYLIGDAGYPGTPMQGGRKTNGTAVTDDIEVLYDGPREFIAVCRTTIWDHLVYESDSRESDVALLQLAITFRFNKVKKCVVLYKDVKSLLVEKEGINMKIQFSNRGEVDLGTDSVSSYAHFYTEGTAPEDAVAEGLPTVYDDDWTLVLTQEPEGEEGDYPFYTAAGPFPQSGQATFDVAQAISPAPSIFASGYVWSAAFWPSLSDWSIDGWDQWWRSMTALDPHYIDYRNPSMEPTIPFYIGEWDFLLWHTLDSAMRTQFRGVTQYAVTDQNDASDANMLFGSNIIDSEIMYYLDETFNPWDLVDAVHKDTSRQLEWSDGDTSVTTSYTPAVYVPNAEWDDYCNFAERIYRMDTGALLPRGTGAGSSYSATYDSATGEITFGGLPAGVDCKILYSTRDYWYTTAWTDLTPEVVTLGAAPSVNDVVTVSGYEDSYTFAADPLGVVREFGLYDVNMAWELLQVDTNFTITSPSLDDWKYDFWVDFEDSFYQDYYFWDDVVYADANVVATMAGTGANMWLEITAPLYDDVYVLESNTELRLTADFDFIWTDDPEFPALVDLIVTFTPSMGWEIEEMRRGRYEWIEVGRDAASVDSVGAALVAEAFDSYKHIGIGIGGADMEADDENNAMPFVMSKFGAGTTADDYKDSIWRAALNDDWCTYWAVASSNMIGVGGPLANLLAYYANDFTDAMYALDPFAGASINDIVPVPCWNRKWPTNEFPYEGRYIYYENLKFAFGAFVLDLGYAVVSTYKDINGTVLFNVWGNTGRDTYYASMWLHGDEARGMMPGLVEMQGFPKGVTSIVLEINYADPEHPTYGIPELLGTISETEFTDMFASDVSYPWIKGGIHDP